MSNNPTFSFSNPLNSQNTILFSNPVQNQAMPFQTTGLFSQTSGPAFGKSTNAFPPTQPNTFLFGENSQSSAQSQTKDPFSSSTKFIFLNSNPFTSTHVSSIQNQEILPKPEQTKLETSSTKLEAQNLQEIQIVNSDKLEKDHNPTEEPKNETSTEIKIESLEFYKSGYKKCDDLNNLLRAELKAKTDEIISLRRALTEHDKVEKGKANEIEAKVVEFRQDLAERDIIIANYKAEITEIRGKKHELALNNFQLRTKIALLQKNFELAHQNYKKKLQTHDDLLREQIRELEKKNQFEKEKFVNDIKSIKRKFKSEMTAELKQNLVDASKFQFHNLGNTENLAENINLNQQISLKTKELEAIKDEIDFSKNSLERMKEQINSLSEYEVKNHSHFMQETYGIVLVFLLGFLVHILVGP